MSHSRTAPKSDGHKGAAPEFAVDQPVVHPSHGVGTVRSKGVERVGGYELDMLLLDFPSIKASVRVPLAKVASVGLRHVASKDTLAKVLKVLGDKPKASKVMWSRRALDTEAKINSGDVVAIAEAMRDMYKPEGESEPSYSQRRLYESARERLVGEVAAAHGVALDVAMGMIAKATWVPPKGARAAAPAADDEDQDVAA